MRSVCVVLNVRPEFRRGFSTLVLFIVVVVVVVCVCVCAGDTPELHDHDGGSAGPAVGDSGGQRETRAGGREEPTHTAVSTEQKVSTHQH